MADRAIKEPTALVSIRVPVSRRDALLAEAEANGVTLSDVLRARLTDEAIKPLGKARPRHRPSLEAAATPRCDPHLVWQVAAIGSNVNQIARAVNARALTGERVDAVALIAQLSAIEYGLEQLIQLTSEARRPDAHQVLGARNR